MAAVELRVRQKDLTAAVRALEDPLVLVVGTVPPEDDEREAHRDDELPVRVDVDPLGEETREPHVLALDPAQPFRAVAPQHRPELQRTEAPAERRAVLRE